MRGVQVETLGYAPFWCKCRNLRRGSSPETSKAGNSSRVVGLLRGAPKGVK